MTPQPTGLRIWLAIAALVSAIALPLFMLSPSEANILTRILREAGESAGDAGKLAARKGRLDAAAARVAALPEKAKVGALAVAVTPEGHWTFRNAAGETVTAAGPEEISAALKYLTPGAGAVPGSGQAFYLTEDAAFTAARRIDELPSGAALRLAHDGADYRLLRIGSGNTARLEAEIRPNVLVGLDDKALFREALWQLQRPIKRAEIRVLSLQPGAARTLPRVRAKSDAGADALPQPEAIDPFGIKQVLPSLRGQTVVVTGQSDGRFLRFQPSQGGEQTVLIDDLMRAAEANDVNLFILEATTTRQPGSRNLVWQRSELSGLAEAMKASNRADFLNALGEGRSKLLVSVNQAGGKSGDGRYVRLSAQPVSRQVVPESGNSGGGTGTFIDGIFTDIVASVTGQVVTAGGRAVVRSEDYQTELDGRIVPGIPSDYQFIYFALFILGLMGLGMVRSWWDHVWPLPPRETIASLPGYLALRGLRLFLMLAVFMPLVAVAAFPASIALMIWNFVSAPFRWWANWRGAS